MKQTAAIILLLLAVITGTASAVEVTIFGPNQYVRTSGAPNVFQDSFVAYPGTGTLIVKNGDQDGDDRITDAVSSAKVLVNGEQIFGPNDFNQNVYLLQAPVDLLSNNTISIELASNPNSYITVEVIEDVDPPTVSLTADPSPIFAGDSATLTWQSTTADTCAIDQGIGPVAVNGDTSVSPTETTTYTISATGLGGTATATATVTVLHLPTVVISVDPPAILSGESATLSWTSTYADSATIDPDVGSVPPNASTTVSPAETTTYTITVIGPGGTATASTTLAVEQPSGPPTVIINATPASIELGDMATLSWDSTDANSAHIDNGIGVVNPNGAVAVSPEHTTTYTITVTGDTGSGSARVTVKVIAAPLPLPAGSFGEQYQDLIPPDATVDEYDSRRFSLVTGLVQDPAGAPIEGVSITILGHTEYGTAATDAEGRFTIPVEGGGTLTVVYQKDGLLSSQRNVYVPWNDIANAETIQMIAADSAATTLTFDGNPTTVVTHQSTVVTDEFGSRSASMVFTGDNRAFLVDENGNDVMELATITARATEYTTPESMPAKLPPNSGYTYCAELAVDGAQNVRFEKPVIMYVDNFLGFDVGMAVPVGYYDRNRGVWVPSDNGVVVKLLDTDLDGIVDALDATGDDQPDDLDNNGSVSNEVQGLEDPAQYAPGATFWRFAVTHFSPWDCNWPYGPPIGAIAPNMTAVAVADQASKEPKICPVTGNSFVDARSRVYHEDIPIPGTDIALHYASNSVDGFSAHISVPASGETVPAVLKRILVRVEVAGNVLEQSLDPLPGQKADIIWDGRDHLGRPLRAPAAAHISVGFVYDAVYHEPSTFARAFAQAGTEVTGIRGRGEVISWKRDKMNMDPKARGSSAMAEGWTISNVHHLAPSHPWMLFKGDGEIEKYNLSNINTVAGDGSPGSGGDGGPATAAQLYHPHDVAADAAVNIYIADLYNHRIRKVDPSGIITNFAGIGLPGYHGDGEPATSAYLYFPHGVFADASGNLYISDTYNNRIRNVDSNGIIFNVAGNGVAGYSGDGGPATAAQLNFPHGLFVDASGNIYIADLYNHRIRKVDSGGIITTVAGNGVPGYSGDEGPAAAAQLFHPAGVTMDAAGNLYIIDSSNHRVRRVDASGIITTVAGNGTPGYSGDGGPAITSQLNVPHEIAIDAAGNLYIVDEKNNRIRKIDTSGIITTVVASGDRGYGGDGGPATAALLNFPSGISLDAAGTIYVADESNQRIRKITPPTAAIAKLSAGDILFPENQGLGHTFAGSGLHTKTLDLESGVILRTFSYNQDNHLQSIVDQFGNTISIQRDVNSGVPTAIISADGIRTDLTIDANNHLTQISYADGSYYSFQYTADGLMTAEIEPEGNRFDHGFDASGRLSNVFDEQGGHWSHSRSADENEDILTEVLTAEGNLTSYLDHTESSGAFFSTITDPTGTNTLFARSADGLTVNKSLACGMDLEFRYDADSEFEFQFVKEMTESTPAGLQRITLRDKTYEDTDSDEIPDLIGQTVTINGKATQLVHNTLQAQKVVTSPQGRTVTTVYDPATLLTERVSIPGLYDTTYGYDTRGRLTSIQTDARQTLFAYNAEGFLGSITDPQDHTTTYDYDPVGRITGINRPDGGSVSFSYDNNGNMTVLTNPVEVSHDFGFNKVNLNSAYTTPLSGSYSYIYDKDRRLIQTSFPSGKSIINVYADPLDPGDKSRLWQIQTPEGNVDFTYSCGTKIDSISKGAESITYGYDGKLVTSETSSGTLGQSLGYTYDDDFDVTSFSYAGQTTSYSYDNDGLLTGAGSFNITRNAGNGMPEAVADGTAHLALSFNGYGENEQQSFSVSGQNASSWALSRNNNGRIITKSETIIGTTANYEYSYDQMGRLLTVTKDGVLVEEYAYDLNGTRISETNTLRGIAGRTFSYSDEDHLLTAGDTQYQYDLDGFLTTKTDGTEVTTYNYSSRGELLSVSLPDGTLIEYVYDPLGRRIAKKINGNITEKYLWQGLTRLLAVYDGSGNLLMRFEYAGMRMPVVMTYGGGTYYMAYDQVGSLRAVADSASNVVKSIEYDAFGNVINNSNPAFYVPFGFAGGLYDADTGLVRFGFRDYDPDVGRWTAKDPILFAGGDTDLYGYVLNDPVNLIDPDGLRTYAGRINLTFFLADVTIGVVADDKGNIGLQFTAAIGFSLSAGVTAGGTVTNAPCINSLEGIGTSAGAAFNIPGFVPGASAEVNKVWTGGPFDEGKPGVYEGIDVGILGVGVGLPATPQVFTGITTTLFQGKWK